MRPMTVVISPHTMEIGGSQLNAVELAAQLQARGHTVLVHGPAGPLVDRVTEAGLRHVEEVPSRRRPGLATTRALRRLVQTEEVDVVHGFEWPPILEAAAATHATRAVAVGTVMSMGVAPFLPSGVPLTVGTRQLQRETPVRRAPVHLWEPPVDVVANRPGAGEPLASRFAVPSGAVRVVVVSRLVTELKLEGILTACRVVGRLARELPLRLLVVGDGPARGVVEQEAARANLTAGCEAVTLAGELPDPRGAYDAADVVLGMGGSALRGLAFGKPLVVQGEGGFFEVLSSATVHTFLEGGWYGVADRTSAEAELHLERILTTLLDDPGHRERLGDYGRSLVCERFSLDAAGALVEELYRAALADRVPLPAQWLAGGRTAAGLLDYKLQRRRQRRRGVAATDDFNARVR